MSLNLSGPRKYIRSVIDELGYIEWSEAFIATAIPDTLLDRSYHMEPGPATRVSTTQSNISFYDVVNTVRIFRRGFEQSSLAVDEILESGEVIANALTDVVRRTNEIGNVQVNSASPVRLAGTSDNGVTLELSVVIRTFTCPDNAPLPPEEPTS